MKVFHGSFGWHGGRGAFKEIEVIVVAETEFVALGQCLMDYPLTTARDWKFKEIDTQQNAVILVSTREG